MTFTDFVMEEKPNQPPAEHRSPAPLTPEQLLDEHLAQVVANFGLDPSIATAYSSRSDGLYTYGNMDTEFSDSLTAHKLSTLGSLVDGYDLAYNKRFLADAEISEPRAVRRDIQAGNRRVGRSALDALMAEDRSREWFDDVYRSEDWGLQRSRLSHAILAANQTHYFSELTVKEDPLVSDLQEGLMFAKDIFNPAELESSVKISDLARRLREQGAVNLSKEHLDARFEHFTLVTQLEATNMFLEGLRDLSRFGGPNLRQAKTLASKHHNNLFTDDYEVKVEMTRELAKTLAHAAALESSPQLKGLFRSLSRRAEKTALHLDRNLRGFVQVYDTLGYELPQLLQTPNEDIVAASPKTKLSLLPGEEAVPKDGYRLALLQEIDNEASQLHMRSMLFSEPWKMTARSRREGGFDPMQRELINGATGFLGNGLLPPMNKADAKQLIDILAHLYDLADVDDPDSTKQLLAQVFDQQNRLMEDFQLISMVGQEAKVRVEAPPIIPVREIIDTVRNNWTEVRQLMLKTWPNYEGSLAVRRLESLLFESLQSVENDPTAQRAVDIQENIAQQLDKLILPPGATQQDLERELRRVGAERTSVSRIEWQRLDDLIELRTQFNGTLFRSKEKALGNAPPYFVVVFSFGDDTYAVAESPMFGNATYIVSERHAPGTWLEVLELSKSDARAVGAHRVIHKQGDKSRAHLVKIHDKLLELHATQPD